MEILVNELQFSNVDSRFSHLSQEDVAKLMELYYDGEKDPKY